MATAESVFDGLGHLEEEIIIHFPTGQKDQSLVPAVTLTEPPEWSFYPQDPFSLDTPLLFRAMRRLVADLFSYA